MDVFTPPLDGTILPGVTRASVISLIQSHGVGELALPHIPSDWNLHVQETVVTMPDIARWAQQGRLLEAWCVGTGVVVAPVGRFGYEDKDIVLPRYELEAGHEGYGRVTLGIKNVLLDIQFGRREWKGWSVAL